MPHRVRLCYPFAALLVLLAACGDDAPDDVTGTSASGDTTEERSTTTDNAPEGVPAEVLKLERVDIAQIVQRGCQAWRFDDGRDDGAINDAIYSLLYNAPAELGLDEPANNRAQFNALVRDACATPTDPDRAWAVLSTGLGVSNEDFTAVVASSCEIYLDRRAAGQEDDGFDEFIQQVVGVGDLTDLIDQICA